MSAQKLRFFYVLSSFIKRTFITVHKCTVQEIIRCQAFEKKCYKETIVIVTTEKCMKYPEIQFSVFVFLFSICIRNKDGPLKYFGNCQVF